MGKSILDVVDGIAEEMILNDYKYENTIYLNDEVDRDSQVKFCRQLRKLVENELSKPIKERRPIKIRITSCGGSVSSFFAMASEIERAKESGLIIETYCDGYAYSAGAFLLIMGTKGHRYATRYCDILLHQMQLFTGQQTHQEYKSYMETLEKHWKTIKKIIKENTNLTVEEIEGFLKFNLDVYYDGEEAVKKGIVDKLI